MCRGFLVAALLGVVGCLGVEADSVVAVRRDGQTPPHECALEGMVCAGVIAREMIGTPQLLRAYLVQRVGDDTDMWQVAYIRDPNIVPGKVYDLMFRNFVHGGPHFLAVNLAVNVGPRERNQAKREEPAPVWTREASEHATAGELNRSVRRSVSWFDAQNRRRTAPVEVHRGLDTLEQAPELPLLGDRYDIEYEGWFGPFELDGAHAVNAGFVELIPCVEQLIDKMPVAGP